MDGSGAKTLQQIVPVSVTPCNLKSSWRERPTRLHGGLDVGCGSQVMRIRPSARGDRGGRLHFASWEENEAPPSKVITRAHGVTWWKFIWKIHCDGLDSCEITTSQPCELAHTSRSALLPTSRHWLRARHGGPGTAHLLNKLPWSARS